MMKRAGFAAARTYCTAPYTYVDIPMNQAYPTPITKRSAANPTDADGAILDNGTKIIAQDHGNATSLISFYVDCGAIYEDPSNIGISDVMNKMLLRSNLQNSDFKVYKFMVNSGSSHWTNQVNRRYISVKVECRRDVVPQVVETLCQGMFIPRFAEFEIEELRDELDNLAATRRHDLKKYTVDTFLSTAFAGSPLANQPFCPATNIDKFSTPDLIKRWSSFFTPNRITLAGVNVSRAELTGAYNSAEWSSANTMDHPSHKGNAIESNVDLTNSYYGGVHSELSKRTVDFKSHQFYNDVYVMYGRKGPQTHNIKEYAAALVAGGSIGGTIGEACGTESQVHAFGDASVIGGLVRSRPEDVAEPVKQMAAAVNSVGGLSGSALDDAKTTAATNFLTQVNTREGLLDFIVTNTTSNGVGKTVSQVVSAIDQVTAADLKKVSEVMQSANPTFVSIGENTNVPNFTTLA
eukprot:TRINITY_DN134_c1_g4_i1.p1 TRINITY_DN134_c1_g4~~TRINITY_DN134_c1_g4_i1.p1  ORF type:complete len:464 (+),score=93.35 TRINITY_DN134_c1_g4_i1:53-1444(+)